MEKHFENQPVAGVAEVEIQAGKALLNGTLTLGSPRPKGTVLFVHGSGSSRHSPRNQFVAANLNKSGISTLLFDLLTEEEERLDARSGDWRFDIELLAERLMEATRWIERSHPPGPLGFFGASTGGGAGLVAAARLGSVITAVVSRGGRPDLAGPYLDRVTAPTLLLVGARDAEVIRLNEIAYAKLRCPKELTLIPAATHLFEEPGTLAEVARLAGVWFDHYFRNAQMA